MEITVEHINNVLPKRRPQRGLRIKCCCLVCAILVTWVTLAAAQAIQLAMTYASAADFDLRSVAVGNLCATSFNVSATLALAWVPWVGVEVVSMVAEARDDASSALFFNASLDSAVALAHSGDSALTQRVDATVALGDAATLAALIAADQTNATISARIRLRIRLAFVPIEQSFVLSQAVCCEGVRCTLVSGSASLGSAPLPPSPPPLSPSASSDTDIYVSTDTSIRLSHPAPATVGADAVIGLSLAPYIPSSVESIELTLPPLHAELLLTQSEPPAAEEEAPVSLRLARIDAVASGLLTARTSLALRAQTANQGRQWRHLAQQFLVPEQTPTPPQIWLRFVADDVSQDGHSTRCPLQSILAALPPLRVPVPVPTVRDYIRRRRRLQSADVVVEGWTRIDASSLQLGTAILHPHAFEMGLLHGEGALNASLGLEVTSLSPVCVQGTVPPFAFSLDSDATTWSTAAISAARPDFRVALPRLEIAPHSTDGASTCGAGSVSIAISAREGLARLTARMFQGAEDARSALAHRSLGPHVDASDFPGLAALRIPAQWLAIDGGGSLNADSEGDTEFTGDAAYPRVEIQSLGLLSASAFDNHTRVRATLAAAVHPGPLSFLPGWLTVRLHTADLTARTGPPAGSEVLDDVVRLAMTRPLTLASDRSIAGNVALNASLLLRRMMGLSSSAILNELAIEGVVHDDGVGAGGAITMSGVSIKRFVDALANTSSVMSSNGSDGNATGLNASVMVLQDPNGREVDVTFDLRPNRPFHVPFAVAMERASLIFVWADGQHPNPLAAADIHALSLTRTMADPAGGATIALAASHRAALEQLSQRLIDGENARLCVHGGVGAVRWNTPDIDICVSSGHVTSGVGSDTPSEDDSENGVPAVAHSSFASVRVLRTIPHLAVIPCIVPGPLCPSTRSLRGTLETATAISVGLVLRIEPAAIAQSLPPSWLVRICVPSVGLRIRANAFEPAVIVMHGGCHMLMRGEPIEVSGQLNLTDWYAASRLLHQADALSTVVLQPFAASTASSAFEHVLPCLRMRLNASRAASNVSSRLLTLPRIFAFASSEGSHGDMTLIRTTRHSATLRLPFGLANPLPLALLVPAASLEVEFEGTIIATAAFEGNSGGAQIAAGSNTLVALVTLRGEDAPSCLQVACYAEDAPPPLECAPCALAKLVGSLTAQLPVNVTVRMRLSDSALVETTLIANTDELANIDSIGRCVDRSACQPARFDGDIVTSSNQTDPLGGALVVTPDVTATMNQIVHNLVPGGAPASLSAVLDVQWTNVLTVPIALHRVQTDAYLQDIDGVGPYGALMSIPAILPSQLPPTPSQLIASRATVTVDALHRATLLPGEQSPVWTLAIPTISMQSVARIVDELYARQQMCLTLDGLADVALRCTGDACTAGADEFEITVPLSLPRIGSLKPRACHVPSTCVPDTSIANGRDGSGLLSSDITVNGDATLVSGQLQLLNGAEGRGSAFLTQSIDDLFYGFTTTFSFEIAEAACSLLGSCHESTGGLAFVMQSSSPTALGEACHPLQQEPTGRMNWHTRIACAGYAGLGSHSIGVIFSSVDNQLWTSSLSSTLSDWERGGLALVVNGHVVPRAASSAHGRAQHTTAPRLHAGPHVATITYAPSTRVLAVFLDGHPQPDLFAELDIATDLQMDLASPMFVGFTATSGLRPIATSVSNWHLGKIASRAHTARLVEEGEVSGRVGEISHVTLDLRDSCGLPVTRGGDTVQVLSLSGPSDYGALNATVHDRGDGRHTVSFTPMEVGAHSLRVAISGVPTRRFAFDVLDLFHPLCGATTQ